MEQPLQLFVYGSLRSGFQHPAYTYISQYFSLVSEGKIKGCLYDMGDYPAAVPDQGHFIIGELYRINNPDELAWAFAQLDDYEGVNTENNEPPLYRRESTTVYTSAGEEPAWVYWFNREIGRRPVIESGDVLDYLQKKNQP